MAREALGLSQADLARTLGRSAASISMWETGDRMPGLDDLVDLGRVLSRAPDYFLPEQTEGQVRQPELILRAVATQLAGVDLDAEIEHVLREAEQQRPPAASFHPRSGDPIVAAQEVLSAAEQTKPPINVIGAASRCGARVVRHQFSSDALSASSYALTETP
jgi:transcriptional regulator with XRE-family HTH domain